MKMKTVATFILLASVWLGIARADRPNILIIMTDDMRFDQMAHMGHPYIQTPNLDRLAAEGMRFTQAYASSPLCGPSRMSIFSAQLPPVHRRIDNAFYPDDYAVYLPMDFKQQGYRTALIGKYYEGKQFEKKVRDSVWDFWFKNGGPDFSTYTGSTAKERTDFYREHLYYDQEYEVGHETMVIKGHQTDILFDQASQFTARYMEQPFFAFVSPFAPHLPFNPSKRRLGKYTGKGIPKADNLEFGVGYMKPARTASMTEVYERTCEMIEDVDEGVGRLLQALETSGQLDHTVIIFTSDNGVMFGEHGFGWKRHPWQESVKVPLLIRYPNQVKAGTVCDVPVTLADLLPTCAELTDVALEEDANRYGKSLVPLLTGRKTTVRDATLLLQYNNGVEAKEDLLSEDLEWVALVDSRGWKLIRYRTHPPENMRPDYGDTFLFNLNADPLEMKNLASSHPEIVMELKKKLAAELADGNAKADWL